jgi:ABC-2 type transport system ATP-binding protein
MLKVRYGCTRQIGEYLTGLAPFVLVVAVELGALLAVIAFAVPSGPIRTASALFLTGVLLFAFHVMLAPLASGHAIEDGVLRLRYGLFPFALRVDLRLGEIVEAKPAEAKVDAGAALGPRFAAAEQRIQAAFSAHGLVLLRLREPRPISISPFQRPTAREILVNVDAPGPFLESLRQEAQPAPYLPLPQAAAGAPSASPVLVARKPRATSALSKLQPAVHLRGLTRRFGGFVAVDGLDLLVSEGELFGFLGSNGAGKTTTIRMLVGLLRPTSGAIHIIGRDPWAEPLQCRVALGYVPDSPVFYERLTGREYLAFVAQLRGITRGASTQRIDALLELLELSNSADVMCAAYSFGMRRKLALAAALIHEPSVLVLDEPLTGLDPRSARKVKDLLRERANAGTTVFFSTHDLATAAEVCDQVAIMHRGRLVGLGPVNELRERTDAPDLEQAFLTLTSQEAAECH